MYVSVQDLVIFFIYLRSVKTIATQHEKPGVGCLHQVLHAAEGHRVRTRDASETDLSVSRRKLNNTRVECSSETRGRPYPSNQSGL